MPEVQFETVSLERRDRPRTVAFLDTPAVM